MVSRVDIGDKRIAKLDDEQYLDKNFKANNSTLPTIILKMTVSRPEEYKDVRTADLSTIQFYNLFDKNKSEMKKLLTACEEDGFFYLNLQSEGSEKFWKDLDEIDRLAKDWFAQPTAVKLKTPTVSLSHGLVFGPG